MIFDGMPYKFNSKVFTLSERHPMTKKRYQSVV